MSVRFRRNREDFRCTTCGFDVSGNGYTNHCPECLWSKHVDIMPGDRSHSCAGLMEPVAIEGSEAQFVVVHRCIRCGAIKRNKVVTGDHLESLISVSLNRAAPATDRRLTIFF